MNTNQVLPHYVVDVLGIYLQHDTGPVMLII